jgi:hypothetical protein
MRKIAFVILAFLFLFSYQSKAQTEQNTLMLGGSASFQSVEDESLFIFNPNLGVFVKNNFAIGLQATLLSSDGASQWSLGPFARLYFGKNEKGKFFGQGALSIYGGDGADVTLGGGLTAGYAVFLNQSIALEFAASYHRIGDAGMVVIGAGFQIHFKKEKK